MISGGALRGDDGACQAEPPERLLEADLAEMAEATQVRRVPGGPTLYDEDLEQRVLEGRVRDDHSVKIDSVGQGWVATFERSHSVLGRTRDQEVFLGIEDLLLWIAERLTGHEPEGPGEDSSSG